MTRSAGTRETVLIVEDNEQLAEVYAAFLADSFEVRTVHSGEDALDDIDDAVDLVLLDRRMPGLSGDEVIEALSRREHDCPVVLVTAATPDFDIIEIGFDNYLVKPVEREELLTVVDQTLEQSRYETLIREYYSLTSERSRLEAKHDPDGLANHEEYGALSDRLRKIRSRIDAVLSDIEGPEAAALIERTQTMAVLQESEERYRSLTDDVLDTSDVGTVIVGPAGRIEWVNASIEVYFGLDRADIRGEAYRTVVDRDLDPAVAEPAEYGRRVIDAVDRNRDVVEFECRVTGADGEERWLKHWSKPIETGLYSGGRIEHYYDVTPLVENQWTLDALHEATRELINAETQDAVCECAVEAGRSILAADRVAIFLRDESSGQLSRVGERSSPATDGLPEVIAPGEDNALWETYVQSEARHIAEAVPDAPTEGFAHSFVLPLGNHGVMVIAYREDEGVPRSAQKFAQVLAANAEVTLDRTARERALRDRDDQLEARNEQLRRLNRINAVIRTISQALLAASTRQEIEDLVCERLASMDAFTFVWVGEPDHVEGTVRPVASAGRGDPYLDAVRSEADGPSDQQPPAWEVAESQESVVENNLIGVTPRAPWHDRALAQGFQSAAAVPIEYDGSVIAVMGIFSDTPSLFGDEERSVLEELGQTIGHAINAIDRRHALVADDVIELEFEIAGVDDFFSRLAASDLGGVDIRTVIPQPDGTSIVFFAIDSGTTEEVSAVLNRSPSVATHALVWDDDQTKVFRSTVSEPTIVTMAADHGAHPRAITTHDDGWRFVVAVPRSTDVRDFTDRLAGSAFDVELVARREERRDGSVTGPLNEQIDERLTDRQHEALRSAYFSGYFDWPRKSSGEDVADTMEIDQSTLQQHLRGGQRRVFQALFDRF